MSRTAERELDISSLHDRYDIVGRVGGEKDTRWFVGRRREDGRDVLITVMMASPKEVTGEKSIAQFAADANLLMGLDHPNMPKVLDGVWIGDEGFALITERVQGTTLAEMLKGERIPKPRIADLLTDVDGLLEWARGERLSHRNVSPEGITVERGTNRVFVTLSPMETPKTTRPEPGDDARTIGVLALSILTAHPMGDAQEGPLAELRPDLPQRVAEATEKLARLTSTEEVPSIPEYLASLAMADAIKEGELEVARLDAEFRAQMKVEREKWEAEQKACQLANEAQAKKFADERAEYDRRLSKERDQVTQARAEVERRGVDLQAARAQLDEARREYKQKKSELEAKAKETERRSRELERHLKKLEKMSRPTVPMDAISEEEVPDADIPDADLPAADVSAQDDVSELEEVTAMESTEPIVGEYVPEPWRPIEAEKPWEVPIESDEPVSEIEYDAAAVPEKEKSRRAWVVPVSIIAVVLLMVGGAVFFGRHGASRASVFGPPNPDVATAPPAARKPVVDSAAGSIAPPVLADSDEFTRLRDSIAESDAAAAQRRAARARQADADAAAAAASRAAEQRTADSVRTVVDSSGTMWSTTPPPPIDSASRALRDSIAATRPPIDSMHRDSILGVPRPVIDTTHRDSSQSRPDTGAKTRPDSGVRPRPDTGRVRPDTIGRVRPDTIGTGTGTGGG